MKKTILDACCGGKMFFFDKNHPDVLFQDVRVVKTTMVGNGRNSRKFEVSPNVVADFRNMPYKDNSFTMVVFDPPHLTSLGKKSYMAKKYGMLDKETWRKDLTEGFNECFRVLKPNGILIFKWNEHDIKVSEVLKCAPIPPLFGHPSGKTQKTHWICFMKNQQGIIEDELRQEAKKKTGVPRMTNPPKPPPKRTIKGPKQ
ncbi:methyltransferase domain-containing protein [Allomuricauda sp. ARW1Y1]|jgi:ubiquinone/menaquinone biosynthesis C-methylase UbiE|uniref:methyltransferase domain-containing protein n=1 Tax=Allomuricauda sp. ARW1Y1 TaxID=2663843 RepID=UPI0015C9FBC1|nr:methyltransferase domain-containing protein [Muricauda sp. ARW1Y1]NYJ27533.1 ubiquinone/menaquinone biosynthesis C-methylase UbiE [Muricauda sp. ARW1Y1]